MLYPISWRMIRSVFFGKSGKDLNYQTKYDNNIITVLGSEYARKKRR